MIALRWGKIMHNSPYYLATQRGFYQGSKTNLYDQPRDTKYFTSNIRRATSFDSFDQAQLAIRYLRSIGVPNGLAEYHAILTAPSQIIPPTITDLQEKYNVSN